MYMKLISKKEFEDLSGVTNGPCISIYIPTHKSGEAVAKQKDTILLRTQLQEVKSKLEDLGLNTREVGKLAEPVQKLINDRDFWRHQEEGLAVFLSEGVFRKYTLPIRFGVVNEVADAFYLKPLLPLFAMEGMFYVIALDLRGVHLYEATKHSIGEMTLGSDMPEQIEDAVGYDYEQKSLQYKTQQAGGSAQQGGRASFHGHGEGKEDRKDEVLTYFRMVNKGLAPMLREKGAPVIAACLDYLFPIYQEANTYENLLDIHISGNPQDMTIQELHDQAWQQIEHRFKEESEEKKALFNKLHGTGRTSGNMHEVLPAAIGGRVDTLFLKKGADIRGAYDPEKNEVQLGENGEDLQNISLSNKAAIAVFLQGGNVYLLEEEEMPDAHSSVNALFRY